MPKKDEAQEKLEYIGLDLKKIPKALTQPNKLEYRVPKFYDESQYKQYRYVKIKDIQILLTPANRLDDLEEKYKKSAPLSDYLDYKNEENQEKHAKFLEMLKSVDENKIEELEEEQDKLSKNLPFKVKFASNYLWQIYYDTNTDQYFMLVPTEDSEYEAFFYLLKKKIENKRMAKIFVPISGIDYTSTYLKKTEYQDIENYMWLFTKNWPLVYEVYDKSDELSIQIVGETCVYGKIKSFYNIKLESEEKARSFYKLIKAMFILQTELPNYFEFRTNIGEDGGIEFYKQDRKVEYKDIAKWLKEEYDICDEKIEQTKYLVESNSLRLKQLKDESVLLDLEYIEKEKQISTFLECKKTFFGKVKYFFKYSKGKKKKDKKGEQKGTKKDNIETTNVEIEEDYILEDEEISIRKSNYTIDELIQNYKELQKIEEKLTNILMDINAIKLKNKNLQKKIENASTYIKEIDNHKRSIFEFWKYSNKDEMATLPEGEEEEINIVKKIAKVFDYEEDIEVFGKKYDRILRKELNTEETDALYITNTNILEMLNKIKNNELVPKDLDANLKQIKKEAIEEKTLFEDEEFDIFGGSSDNTKVSQINNKKHREIQKDKFKILEVNKTTKQIGYKLVLEQLINKIKTALEKIEIDEELPVYKVVEGELNPNDINVFDINPISEITENISAKSKEVTLYKINLTQKNNCIPYTNIIFYDNQNKTLPLGMDLSTKMLIDISKMKLINENNFSFSIATFEDEADEFSKVVITKVNVSEFDIKKDE